MVGKFKNEKQMLEAAIALATRKFDKKRDRAGQPYILHCLRVMLKQTTLFAMTVAVLHDIIEDTSTTADDLFWFGFPRDVVHAVYALTRLPGESRMDAARRAKADPVTCKIKVDDVEDNMDLKRLPKVTSKDLKRQAEYEEVHAFLLAA